jgi:hypothetical protein
MRMPGDNTPSEICIVEALPLLASSHPRTLWKEVDAGVSFQFTFVPYRLNKKNQRFIIVFMVLMLRLPGKGAMVSCLQKKATRISIFPRPEPSWLDCGLQNVTDC